MSNVKRVKITGDLNTLGIMGAPDSIDGEMFVFGRDDLVNGQNILPEKVEEAVAAAKVINKFLAVSTLPHFGLKISFGGVSRVDQNGYGGQIFYYKYVIEGQEAIPFPWFDALVAALGMFGKVDLRACVDMEN